MTFLASCKILMMLKEVKIENPPGSILKPFQLHFSMVREGITAFMETVIASSMLLRDKLSHNGPMS